ncbi:hypothetical protein EDEG_01816 [Edhazardia aedis USNM 41457]|uniref:Mediator of RNA polymerase II transcription subunit 31 n=1 Tax=Edhazardia aedis (strain USNM 41457) TaxID=1003232 RepID=J8ZW30_EDHAE|nr:hypothetical protein EDEG_01816 [Edhazardia aedis USNM 41457]|eukprot:EJW03888.1 hypothetical protein EDEG_01816 [Edhazardia aedis USNM 41457]
MKIIISYILNFPCTLRCIMDDNQIRFQKELEFLQLLCNPQYLQHLYNNNFFKNEDFIKFLEYLKYWKMEPYRNFIIYPYSLEILDLCLDTKFIEELANEQTYMILNEQIFNLWNNS